MKKQTIKKTAAIALAAAMIAMPLGVFADDSSTSQSGSSSWISRICKYIQQMLGPEEQQGQMNGPGQPGGPSGPPPLPPQNP